jgi:uncharacterized protein YlxP (DUF503 family)
VRRGGSLVVIVGVCRITFGLPGNDSLKGKRRVVRRILDRTRNQFNAAVAEVGNLDEHRRASIGIAVVSNDGRHANSMLDTIAAFASSQTEAVVLDRSLELVHVGSGERLDALQHDWGAAEVGESDLDVADDEELEP